MPASDPNASPSRLPLFIAWVLVMLATPLLSVAGRELQHWAFDNLGRSTVGWIIGGMLVVMGAGALWVLWRRTGRHQLRRTLLLLVLLATALAAIVLLLPRVEERLHFVTFGAFGYFSALLFPPLGQLSAVVALSGGDELLQYYLSDRTGSIRDVIMNLAGGGLGLLVAHAVVCRHAILDRPIQPKRHQTPP